MDIYTQITDAIKNREVIHLIGIGGVSMKSLAQMLHELGAEVQGSDKNDSESAEKLREMGIKVFVGHNAQNAENAHIVIRTSAVHEDNPEIKRAKQDSVPIISRAEAWGALMSKYPHRLCIAGTHGKTTATGMAACAAMQSGLDPAVMIGGDLPAIGGAFRSGDKQLFIAESCEYCNSYHSFYPSVAVILNIDEDHLDFFGGLGDIIESFKKFASNTDKDGAVVVNNDDANAKAAAEGAGRKTITFGMDASADVYPQNLSENGGYYSFDVIAHGAKYAHIKLNVPGMHNVLNSLAIAAAFEFMGVCGESFADGIESFTGTGRRFEKKGCTKNGTLIIDDYAHHPSEIRATLAAAKKLGKRRIFCVFQPHTYSRTKMFMQDFARELSEADVPVLTEIYAAREQNTWGVSAKDIADRIGGAEFIEDFNDVCAFLEQNAQSNDLIITMGAGDVYKIGEMLMQNGKA